VGNGAQYQFYRCDTYLSQTPAFGTPTSQYPSYGQGVGYMANGGAAAYSINVTSNSGFYAVQLSNASTPTCYASGSNNVGTAPSLTFWACVGPAGPGNGANSAPSGNITAVTCSGQQLTALDVSGLASSITSVTCASNASLATLNISGCAALTTLGCATCGLSSLDVSSCTRLTSLTCGQTTPAMTLNVSNTALTSLSLGGYNFTSLTANNCPNLASITFPMGSNYVTSVNISYCPITSISYGGTPITTSVAITGCSALTSVLLEGVSSLTSVAITNCTALTSVICVSNSNLTSLNVSGCTKLKTLTCPEDNLGSLNITGDHAISSLTDSGNPSVTITGP